MKIKAEVITKLEERGVDLSAIAEVVYKLQKPYSDSLTLEESLQAVEHVLDKREVQYTLLTGLALDNLAEEDRLEEPLAEIIKQDDPLYGVDESLALAIANIYGSVGFTSFGYLDKDKIGIIKELDTVPHENKINTFLDDLVAAVASAASARIAHEKRNQEQEETEAS